jgi:hypothetical protein
MAPQPLSERAAIETRIRGEFNEMPGLCLTLQQARRLWSLDDATCGRVLDDLMTEGFLRRSQTGVYLRSDRRQTFAA